MTEAEFWGFVDRRGECWEFDASRFDGARVTGVAGQGARRVAFYLRNPEAGRGQIENRCGNRFCVRPLHQEFVRYGENRRKKIFLLRQMGLGIGEIASEVGVSRQTVWRVLNA